MGENPFYAREQYGENYKEQFAKNSQIFIGYLSMIKKLFSIEKARQLIKGNYLYYDFKGWTVLHIVSLIAFPSIVDLY